MPDTDVSQTKPIANPAPLGLCGFALTTFVLSCANAGFISGPQVVLGLAFFYGGLAQMLAGMWEFKTGNTFGATAFTSYGAFWIALATNVQFKLIPDATSMGIFLLGWTIFTLMMFLASLKTNVALMVLFLSLLITFALLTASEFGATQAHHIGGYSGIVTALIAWYTALASLLAADRSAFTLPVWPIK